MKSTEEDLENTNKNIEDEEVYLERFKQKLKTTENMFDDVEEEKSKLEKGENG